MNAVDELRTAAMKLRTLGAAATPGPQTPGKTNAADDNAAYVATTTPTIGLALAALLDRIAWAPDPPPEALTVARAINDEPTRKFLGRHAQ